MELPDGRPLIVADGILAETGDASSRLVLWVPVGRDGRYSHWERVGIASRSATRADRGILAVAASSVQARRWEGGLIGGLLLRMSGRGTGRRWTMPDGVEAEQCGPRRSDLMLAWAEDEAAPPLDEGRIRERWEACAEVRPIGHGVFLSYGTGPSRAPSGPGESQDPPRLLSERSLAEARAAADFEGEVTALADLGLAYLKVGDFRKAEESIEGAIAGARLRGYRAREAEAMADLGLVYLASSRPDRAREVLGSALAWARASDDRYAEKVALERLGRAHAALGDQTGALRLLGAAHDIATGLGDTRHEADIRWRIGILHAEMGDFDRASGHAQAAVDLMARLGLPHAAWYAHHLGEYRSGGRDRALDGAAGHLLGVTIDTSSLPARAGGTSTDPGFLRMALTAAGSMGRFLGSGFQVAPPGTLRDRAEACARCEHHTGLRCRVCGCFTAAKSRIRHERCPIGRWPA